MPTPPSSSGVHISGTAVVSATDIWAVGSWADFGPGDGLVPLIEHWNGSAWSIVPSPVLPQPVANQALSSTAWPLFGLGCLGGRLHRHRHPSLPDPACDGKSWTRVPAPHNGPLAALSGVTAISATDVWAVGTVHTKYLKHFITDTVALRWNGKVWQRMPPPGGGSLLAVTGSEKNIWAVGGWNTRDSGDGQNRTLIVHWIGHWKYFSGHTRSSKSIQQPLTGIAMLPGNEGWAVGYHENEHSLQSQTLIEHFSRGAWSPVKSMNPARDDRFAGVAAASPTAVWAVGTYFPGS